MMKKVLCCLPVLALLLLAARLSFAQPAWNWAVAPVTNTLGESWGYKVALDRHGNTYCLGHANSAATVAGHPLTPGANFLLKLNQLGQPYWMVPIGTASQVSFFLSGLAVDEADNVYLSGQLVDTLTLGSLHLAQRGALVASLTPTGQWRWATTSVASAVTPAASAVALAVAGGRLWVAGSFRGIIRFGTATLNAATHEQTFVAVIDTSGGSWQAAWASQGTGHVLPQSVAADTLGNVYVAGEFYNQASFDRHQLSATTTIQEGYVAKLTISGGWQWARQWFSGRNTMIGQIGVVVDPASGDPIVGGRFSRPQTLDSLTLDPGARGWAGLLARLHAGTGRWRWATRTGPTGQNGPPLVGVAIDATGTLYTQGGTETFFGPAVFGPDTVDCVECLFIASADVATGQWRHAWPTTGGGTAARSLAARGLREVVIAGGVAAPSPRFGPYTIPLNSAPITAYVAKLLDPTTGLATTSSARLSLYPNPARHTVQLTNAPAGPIMLFDATGRIVLHAQPATRNAQLDLRGLPPGLYLLRAGEQTKRLVVE